jgi:hypothetical protein
MSYLLTNENKRIIRCTGIVSSVLSMMFFTGKGRILWEEEEEEGGRKVRGLFATKRR